MPKKDKKTLSVTLPHEAAEELRAISQTRKDKNNLAWSQTNILVEQISKLHKKECNH